MSNEQSNLLLLLFVPRALLTSFLSISFCPLFRSNWLKPCCGRRAALWQVCLLSAGFNCFLVACVILVVVLLTLELLIDTKLLQCECPYCTECFISSIDHKDVDSRTWFWQGLLYLVCGLDLHYNLKEGKSGLLSIIVIQELNIAIK